MSAALEFGCHLPVYGPAATRETLVAFAPRMEALGYHPVRAAKILASIGWRTCCESTTTTASSSTDGSTGHHWTPLEGKLTSGSIQVWPVAHLLDALAHDRLWP